MDCLEQEQSAADLSNFCTLLNEMLYVLTPRIPCHGPQTPHEAYRDPRSHYLQVHPLSHLRGHPTVLRGSHICRMRLKT